MPTLYHLAGGDINDLGSIDGINQWDAISRGGPSSRDLILLNLDEQEQSSGAMKGRFKYITGNHKS